MMNKQNLPWSFSVCPECPTFVPAKVMLFDPSIGVYCVADIRTSLVFWVHIIEQVYTVEILDFLNHCNQRSLP